MNRYINIIIAVAVACLASRAGLCAAGIKKEVKKGNLLYNKGKFDEALKAYEQALSSTPDSDVINFNTATALYKTEQFEAAAGHFEKALLSDDESLRQKAQYNLGNAQYKYGISLESTDLERAVSLLENSLLHYERALSIDPKDEDARFNYEFVEKELRRLKEKLEKQRSQQNQESEDKQSQQKQRSQTNKQQEGQKEEQAQQQQQAEQQQKQTSSEKQPLPEQQSSQQVETTSSQPMSEQEARMLLRGYQQQEEPQGLYQQKLPVGELPPPQKDW